MKLQLLEKKDLAEPEIDIRYSSMTQPLNRIVQYIRQQEYLIQGIFEKKLYQIPLNEVLYFETVDKKTFMYTQQKIFECKKTLSAIEQDLISVTDLMNCHGFAYMNCHQIDWFSVISQPHRAAA